MSFEIIFVPIVIVVMVAALIMGRMRPGILLFSAVVLLLSAGIISPKEALEGFSNKGMITVALLFLVSAGVSHSGALSQITKKLLPKEKTTIFKAQLRILPAVAAMSAFLNNTPVVVILSPAIRRWAQKVKLPPEKFLIPLSYVTIMGGVCTLIGTSTNLVVQGLIIDAGYEGLTMFELGKVGIFIAIFGIAYILIASKWLLPEKRIVESKEENLKNLDVEGDKKTTSKKMRYFALILLFLMIIGATLGELPVVKNAIPNIRLDMFFFAAVTVVIMAWTGVFPAKKYTQYISWDILITIACAFAISKAIMNSGFADLVARGIISLSENYGPHVLLALVFIITNIFTELITNNAAAALTFPLAISLSNQLGVSPTPFFVVICMAASASFSSPIGYQTHLIVQDEGGYRFTDFTRMGLPLNIITFLISVILIPIFWSF